MLEGIKVVEMASIAAGPGAAAMLAEWGADVVKVEPLKGDPGRHSLAGLGVPTLEINAAFDLHNRGKRSIALQLNAPEGREIVLELARHADIFLTSTQPHKLEQHKLDWPDLRAINPRIIYANITGYGRRGPDRELPGTDHSAFWSRSGAVRLTSPTGTDPVPIRMAMGDRMTALSLVSGILAAYIDVQRTGRGKLVETSLLRTGIYAVATDIGLQIVRGRVGSNKPRHENVNPLYGFYPTKDDRWIAVNLGRAANMGEALGHPELGEDRRFATFESRRRHNAEIVEVLDGIFRERTLDEWCDRFRQFDFVWAPVQSAADVLNDPQAEASGAFVEVPRSDGKGSYRGLAMPAGFFNDDGSPDGLPRTQAPKLGEHTDEILQDIGHDTQTIAGLRRREVIL